MRAVRAVASLTNALQVRTLVAGEQLGRRAMTRDVERRTLEPGGFPMLKVLSEDVRECYQRAEECARQAKAQLNPELRRDFLDLELRWLSSLAVMKSLNGLRPSPSPDPKDRKSREHRPSIGTASPQGYMAADNTRFS